MPAMRAIVALRSAVNADRRPLGVNSANCAPSSRLRASSTDGTLPASTVTSSIVGRSSTTSATAVVVGSTRSSESTATPSTETMSAVISTADNGAGTTTSTTTVGNPDSSTTATSSGWPGGGTADAPKTTPIAVNAAANTERLRQTSFVAAPPSCV